MTPTEPSGAPAAALPERGKWRELAANLGLSLGSIVLFLLICEFLVFRFVWLASDVPANAFIGGLIRYAPNQQGVWRLHDEIAAPYRINGQGWNSGIGDYRIERRPGTARIAIVGDSYIEALQVPYDGSVGEFLAAELSDAARPVEVYRFGVSGAPMSQYLEMVEREAVRYRPDWVVVQLVHNDFDESYKVVSGRYASSFMKLRIENGKITGELQPRPWSPGPSEWLRQTATARFLLSRWQVRPQLLVDLFLGRAQAADRYQANIEIDSILADAATNEAVTDYVFSRLDAVTRAAGARLLVAIDGDRRAIEMGKESRALFLNRLAERVALARRIPFVDLQSAFAADWQSEHRRFGFDNDNHWNTHAHRIAAAAMAAGLREAGWPQ